MQRRQGSRPQAATAQRLNSWKEIAAYLGTSERTVQRWEQGEALPVHRHVHEKASSIYAYPVELEEWLRRRQPVGRIRKDRKPKRPAVAAGRRGWLWWLAAAGVVAAGVWAWRG
ncbi:MAG: hypothetical protein M9913_14565 [Bryobacteraceae bacterium]|nr:hypothetical protein [Solibacteraceae bacterium]MCO5352101.1 hypothetical protein [Bryobacteraceae bacterium]